MENESESINRCVECIKPSKYRKCVNCYFNTINKTIGYGKYKGQKLLEIKRNDPDYLNWLISNEKTSKGLQYCAKKIKESKMT
jgi:hypothetical protein